MYLVIAPVIVFVDEVCMAYEYWRAMSEYKNIINDDENDNEQKKKMSFQRNDNYNTPISNFKTFFPKFMYISRSLSVIKRFF